MLAWHLISAEFPPIPGGVGDYTRGIAEALALRGREVHVWTSATPESHSDDPAGVQVHRLLERWDRNGLDRLDSALSRFPGPRTLMLQYVPHSYGGKGINFDLGPWLARRRQAGDDVRTLFHEVAYPFLIRDRPWRWLLAAAQRRMAREVLRASRRVYVSVPAWEPILRGLLPDVSAPIDWLPIPSNITPVDDPEAVRQVRARYSTDGQSIVGCFGTYGSGIRPGTRAALLALLTGHEDRVALLIGRNGPEFARELTDEAPSLKGRLHATGSLDNAQLSSHLRACDVFLQYYSDGLSTRRTTLMAILAHGKPVVGTLGHNSESFWQDQTAASTVPVTRSGELPALVESLLADPEARVRLGERARLLYDERFAVGRIVDRLDRIEPLVDTPSDLPPAPASP